MPSATVIPILEYPDVAAAAKWLEDAFAFRTTLRIGDHRAQLRCGCGAVVIRKADVAGAVTGGASIMVRIEEINGHFARALMHGACIVSEVADFPYGERQYSCEDLVGYRWTFSETIADVDPASWGGEVLSEEASDF